MKEDTLRSLNEMRVHISKLAESLQKDKSSPNEDVSVCETFGHLLEHLVFAWHSMWCEKDITGLSQNEFESMCHSIPNFDGDFRLLADNAINAPDSHAGSAAGAKETAP